MTDRRASVTRETSETSITVALDVDGEGTADVETGIGFFDHMLESFAAHGLFDLEVDCNGDLEIDDHHTIEDVALTLGAALDDALGNRAGIVRYADRRIPMDEALATVVVDLSGRPLLSFDGEFSQDTVGEMSSVMARHFLRSLATSAGATVHARVRGGNAHHEIEALFKATARALDDATRRDTRREGTPSTKGQL